MGSIEVDDHLLLPVFQPVITGHPGVVFVDLAITSLSVEEFAGANPDPTHQARGGQFGLLGPFAHKVDDPIAQVRLYPNTAQSPPSLFFR